MYITGMCCTRILKVQNSLCRYVNNVKGALDKFPELKDLGLVDLNKAVGTSKIPSDLATVIRCVKAHNTTPDRRLLCAIAVSVTTFDWIICSAYDSVGTS